MGFLLGVSRKPLCLQGVMVVSTMDLPLPDKKAPVGDNCRWDAFIKDKVVDGSSISAVSAEIERYVVDFVANSERGELVPWPRDASGAPSLKGIAGRCARPKFSLKSLLARKSLDADGLAGAPAFWARVVTALAGVKFGNLSWARKGVPLETMARQLHMFWPDPEVAEVGIYQQVVRDVLLSPSLF